MIVFLNMDGTARIVSPERIFQGSNVNIVSAIYGGASNTPLQIAFTLPNGFATSYAPMFYNIASQEEAAGVWEYKIPRTVTEKVGTVGMTICATLPNGQQTSYNLTFNVEYAVLPVLPPEPDESVYDLILKYLAENQSQIVNLDTRVTDLENQVVRKTLLDITAEVEENQTVFTKYYTDGTTAQFSIPAGSGTAGRVNGNIVIKFTAANWRDTGTLEAPSGVYEIAFGPQQTGQGNSDFLSELSIADSYTYESGASVVPTAKNGYSTLAQKVFKGSDGSVLLTDVRVPFDGQLILFGGEYPTDATLSNVDGNSEVDGFTQSAVKGIAQAKNYYNLGAYDTYVSNGNGTGTVARKTQYNDDGTQSLLPVQYQYTEQVIENQPIRPANQEEENYGHEEFLKGKNLLAYNKEISLTAGTNVFLGIQLPVKANEVYTISAKNIPEWVNAEIYTDTVGAYVSCKEPVTFSFSQVCEFRVGNDPLTQNAIFTPQIMLTKGAIPYSYEPYSGGIVREKDLSGVQLFPEGVNPAQTIGGDWEDEGTITTSNSTVLHAYRRL